MGRERFPYSVTDMTKQSPHVQTGSPSCRRVPSARRGGTPPGHVHALAWAPVRDFPLRDFSDALPHVRRRRLPEWAHAVTLRVRSPVRRAAPQGKPSWLL